MSILYISQWNSRTIIQLRAFWLVTSNLLQWRTISDRTYSSKAFCVCLMSTVALYNLKIVTSYFQNVASSSCNSQEGGGCWWWSLWKNKALDLDVKRKVQWVVRDYSAKLYSLCHMWCNEATIGSLGYGLSRRVRDIEAIIVFWVRCYIALFFNWLTKFFG